MKKDDARLLKKALRDLTPADIAALERPLGTSDRPFPMWGTQRIEHQGRTSLEQVLSVIADDTYPLKVYSDRPYREVVALAYCDMPVPSMLPVFFDGLERRKPASTNRTQFMIGDPGHGKSFLGALQGRLRAKGSVEVYDCGGKNMNDLLFEMVLDFGAGDALPKAIDKRLKAGTLESLSLALLKGLPDGTLSKDEDGNILSIDWNGLKHAGTADVQTAYDVLKKVSSIEGFDNAGGNALGMNSTYGALIRAFIEKREIVLDEYNKSREGSDNALQTVLQFLIGEIKECTVENPLKNKDSTSGPSSFTFRQEDMGLGFFVTFTGNRTEDGVTTRSLNKSVYSRLSPQTLPDPDVIDWQHRICQMMVGLPVSTIYAAFKDQADADPDAFGDWLMWLRKTKADIEGAPIPELQETLLTNWQNVIQSSENLAEFYHRWSEMTDAEKLTSNGNSDLLDEVDEEYTKKEGIDFRKIKQHLEEAIPVRPRMLQEDAPRRASFKAWEKSPQLSEPVEENASLRFGTRLAEFLERNVFEKSGAVGKQKLYAKLQKSMEEFGLRDISLQEAARSGRKSVEENLNISAFSDRDINKQAAMARKIFCQYLRQTNPDITASDDEIVTPKKFLDAVKYVAEKETVSGALSVVTRDPEAVYGGNPLENATIEDAAVYSVQQRDIDLTIDDLVHHDDLMAAFALPTVTVKNLAAVWDQNIRPLIPQADETAAGADGAANGNLPDIKEGLDISENRSKHGIATTSLQVYYDADGQEGRAVSVHIVHNSLRNKTLIVGEKVPSKLLSAFREAGITHVDRNDPAAAAKVDAAVSELTRGMSVHIRDRLVEAFKYRNDTETEHLNGKNPQLADLLVDPNIDMMYGKFVAKGKKQAPGI